MRDMIDEGNTKFKEVGEGLKKVIAWEDVGVCYLPVAVLLFVWELECGE